MITKVMSGAEAIREGKQLIISSGVVAFPSETVYGLGANALDEVAVYRIFEAKGRPSDNPLIVHIADLQDIYKIADNIPEDAFTLAKKFMPGPITLVLNKKDVIPYAVTAGLDTVAIRMPDHPVAIDFIRECGVPIAAPSANISTHISPTTASHVYNDLNGRIPLIIDGGSSDVGIESTVIDMTKAVYCILRPGYITRRMIEDELGRSIEEKYTSDTAPASPGMKYRHYAPHKPVKVIDNTDDIIKMYDRLTHQGESTVIITRDKLKYGNRHIIDVGNSSEQIARNIYSALRDAEKQYAYIITENFEDEAIGHSIMNRLNKASKEE